MPQSYITKNVNITLLFLILLSAAALVGATVYFQVNFDKVNKAYHEKLSQLEQVSKELETQQGILNKVKEELSLKTEREEEFSEKYTEVKGEKEVLSKEKIQLEQQREDLEEELEVASSELSTARYEIEQQEEKIVELEKERDECKARLANCKNDLDACESS